MRLVTEDDPKIVQSQSILEALAEGGQRPNVAAQTIAELHSVLSRKAMFSPIDVSRRIQRLCALANVHPTDAAVLADAIQISRQHGYTIFDSIILSAAAQADCDLLLSEDMQDGFTWRGVTILNPFTDTGRRRLARRLG